MAGTVDLLGTDMYREHHRRIAAELDGIERELAEARGRGSGLDSGLGPLRRLLVLLEADVERHADEEEHALYAPLARAEGVTPTLAACYREHGALRLGIERLRRDLRHAVTDGAAAGLFEDCAEIIELVRAHMAREDEILFPNAEQNLDRATLAAIPEAAAARAALAKDDGGGRS